MPLYIYTGPGHSLSLSGRTLVAGQPTILEGRAADAAELHPDVQAYKPTKSKPGPAPKAEPEPEPEPESEPETEADAG